jgi:hypothetical protein
VAGLNQPLAFAFQTLGLVGFSQSLPAFQIPVEMGGATPAPAPAPGAAAEATPVPASSGGLKAKCPIDFSFDKRGAEGAEDGVFGLKRVTRHPQLWAMGIAGVGTALGTPFIAEMVMFTSPFVMAAICTPHQDYRYRKGEGGELSPEKEAKTSNIPFAALLSGRQDWGKLWNETKKENAAIGTNTHTRMHTHIRAHTHTHTHTQHTHTHTKRHMHTDTREHA